MEKNKAQELIERFMPYSDYNECDIYTQRENQLKNAKECALIFVDEMIKELDCLEKSDSGYVCNSWGQDDWLIVKKEIISWQH